MSAPEEDEEPLPIQVDEDPFVTISVSLTHSVCEFDSHGFTREHLMRYLSPSWPIA